MAFPLPPPPGFGALPLSSEQLLASPSVPLPLKVKRIEEDPTPPINPPETHSNGSPKPGVDIDWDDEDEATQVFDRTQEDASRSLLLSAPPAPPPAAGAPATSRANAPPPAAGNTLTSRAPIPATRPISAPPAPTAPRAPLPPPARTLPTSSFPAPALPAGLGAPSSDASAFARGGAKKTMLLVAGGVVVAAVVAATLAVLPKQGSLVVTVAGPGNKPLSELEVYVDGAKRCASSPCQIRELKAGTHLVRVSAPGFEQTADQAVKVVAGDEAIHNVTLTRGSGGSGLTVRAEGRGLKLAVDGKDIGPLPQELSDLTPGEHLVRIDGGDRYEPFEKRVTVETGQLTALEPKLKVKKGLATIKPGMNADDARVVLVSGSERRPVPQLPLAVDIPVDKPYSIVATKRGFQDFEQKLEFEDGQAERTFVVDLVPAAASEVVAAPVSHAPAPPRPAPAAAPVANAAAAAAPKPTAGNGTLSLNSIPASNVILDGRPLGATPKVGVSVTPGVHTVIFAHAELGRKAKSVTVQAGKTSTLVVTFK